MNTVSVHVAKVRVPTVFRKTKSSVQGLFADCNMIRIYQIVYIIIGTLYYTRVMMNKYFFTASPKMKEIQGGNKVRAGTQTANGLGNDVNATLRKAFSRLATSKKGLRPRRPREE